jgi:aromatic-L-amino-acid decarboxylase
MSWAQTVAQNDIFASLIRSSAHFKLVTEPVLGLTVFRLIPETYAARSLADQNALNRAFYTRLSARSAELLLTQTDLNGVFCVRMAIGSARTEEKHVRRAFEVLCEEAQALVASAQ